MSEALSKSQMTEEDIKLRYITPAITAKWDIRKITMETRLTDGKVNIKGNLVFREKPKRADYLLYLNPNNPIAVVEAKGNNHSVSFGLQQAMTYARMLDLPFAFSSNGDGFAEHDFLTGEEREFGMDEFPSDAELIERFRRESALTPEQEAVIDQPYYTSQNTYPPRYYQRIAVNRMGDRIIPSKKMMVSAATAERLKSYVLRPGMIVMGRRGEMGRCAVVGEREKGWLCGTGSFFVTPTSEMFVSYLTMLFSTPYAKSYLVGESVGTTMNNLNHKILSAMPVPVPPFAEQKRIVANLEKLLPLCERLK